MPLDQALSEWRSALGTDHVLTDSSALSAAETATFATSARVLAILRPADREQVVALLRIATREGVPVYPVSGGKNWGLGSRVPPRDAVLIELGRMNRILAFDEELAYVTLEPGVSFRQLHDHLIARGSKLMLSSTGGSPEGSVLANAIERGDGSGPNGDRSQHLAALEVVLGSGEVVHTGFNRFDAAAVAPLHRSGVGPSLDGLFTQSRLGLVTRGTIWLAPVSRFLGAVRFSIVNPARLAQVIDALRGLKLDGTLRSIVGIWNDWRVLSTTSQHPESVDIARERAAWGGATWLGLASIYAPTAELGQAARRHVEEVLGPSVDRLEVEVLPAEPADPERDPAHTFLQGIPHEQSLRSAYFKKPGPVPADPDLDRDHCGVLWVSATLPLRGSDALGATSIAERVLPEHGFEPLIALLAVTERTGYLLPMIVYDRDQPGADARARACHDALFAELIAAGYPPYRLGTASMGLLPAGRGAHGTLVARLRELCDPADVLMPGRYDSSG